MTSVQLFLLVVAVVLVVGTVGERIFVLTNLPDALWLLAAGFALGPISAS